MPPPRGNQRGDAEEPAARHPVHDLMTAALFRALGAPLVEIVPGRRSAAVLDMTRLRKAQIELHVQRLAEELERLGDAPSVDEIATCLGNTFLSQVGPYYLAMKDRVLGRT